jgi:tetratricopeptide (TPR) repeat protein
VLLQAAAADPSDPVARQHLALVALRARQWEEARRQAEQALELAGGSLPQAWNYLGVARRRLGDVPGALAAWERASQLAPHDFDLLYNIAFTAAEAGETERARAAAQAFVAGAPPERYAADLPKTRELLRRLERASAGSPR